MVKTAKSYFGKSSTDAGFGSGQCEIFVEDVLDVVVPKFTGTNFCCPHEFIQKVAADNEAYGLPKLKTYDPSAIQPGDVLLWPYCFASCNGTPHDCGHIAVAAGNGQMYTTDAPGASGSDSIGLNDINNECDQGAPSYYLPMGGFACSDGSAPVAYGTAKGHECTADNTVDLSAAVAVIQYALKNSSYSESNRWCTNAQALCPQYDCSSVSSAVAQNVPGFVKDPVMWPGTTTSLYGYSSPVPPGGAPVQWCFAAPSSTDIDANYHMYTTVGAYTVNAHDEAIGINDEPSDGFFCRVPHTLEYLDNSCVCASGGGDSTSGGSCTPTSTGSSGASGGGGGALGSCQDFFEHWADVASSTNYRLKTTTSAHNPVTFWGAYQVTDDIARDNGFSGSMDGFLLSQDKQDTVAHKYAYSLWSKITKNFPDWISDIQNKYKDAKGNDFTLSQGGLIAGYMFALGDFPSSMHWLLNGHAGNEYCDDSGLCTSEVMAKYQHTMIMNPNDKYQPSDPYWGMDNKSCGGTSGAPCGAGGTDFGGTPDFVCPDSFNTCKSDPSIGFCQTTTCNLCVGGYFNAVGESESGTDSYNSKLDNCGGRYGFLCEWTLDTGEVGLWGDCPVGDYAKWQSTPSCQDKGAVQYAKDRWDDVVGAGLDKKYCGMSMTSANGTKFTVTQAALLGGAQFGMGNLEKALATGGGGDSSGVATTDYMAKFSETTLNEPWADPSCGSVGGSTAATGAGSGSATCSGTCGNPALTGFFAHDPCDLPPAPTDPGARFKLFLKNWWKGNFLPAIKDMTSQLYSYRLFATKQMGHIMDAQNALRAARIGQEQRITSHENAMPNEQVCVASTAADALAQTSYTATALTQGLKKDVARRANDVESGTASPPAFGNAASDKRTRWAQYCKEFYDPKSNGAQGACPNPTALPPGGIVNGDISVENFLLKVPIDMNIPHEYAAAQALLVNLVQPTIGDRVPDSVVITTTAQERIIKQQHLEAVNNVAVDVVSSMISRRTALPATSSAGAEVQDMREKLGIPACDPSSPVVTCASPNPSYNEIMQLMTKERFFNPEYFFRMQDNPGTIKQEQASVDAYTTIELQDIYTLQEQINALLAVRASLKFHPEKANNQTPATPLTDK